MTEPADANEHRPDSANWPALWSLMLGVCGLITAEFLQAGLLTPIARSLDISEAAAGQTVTATAVISFFAALAASRAQTTNKAND